MLGSRTPLGASAEWQCRRRQQRCEPAAGGGKRDHDRQAEEHQQRGARSLRQIQARMQPVVRHRPPMQRMIDRLHALAEGAQCAFLAGMTQTHAMIDALPTLAEAAREIQ